MKKKMTKLEGRRPGPKDPNRSCVHVKNGGTGIPKTCIRNFECGHCAFDQWLEVVEEGPRVREFFTFPRVITALAA
ncbi:MAG: hypothetical protein GY864_01720 [Desulfobacterales bacterium]|nr:hypothetical protein [Desulfobacterales bacterium]